MILLAKNAGYAGNNNVGIQAALDEGADWILILNEDTIAAPDCIQHLVEIGEGSPRIGILGPLIFHHDEPRVIQSAGGSLDGGWWARHIAQNETDRGQFTEPRQVDWVSGCALLVRRQLVEDIGMLDERFFYYWDEVDWCMRARRRGWSVVHVPRAHLWHKGVRRDYHPGPSVTYYDTRNRFLFLKKHGAPLSAWLRAWRYTVRTLATWTLRPKWRGMREHRAAMWQGALDFVRGRLGMREV
jgi:GT2 family glycosyltransferase